MTKKAFRDFLHDLEGAGEVQRIARPVDPRDLSGLAAQTDKAVLFEEIEGYPGWRVATALLSSRRRLAITLGCEDDRIAQEFETRSSRAIAPDIVGNAPCQEVVMEGDDVDLAALPFPMMHVHDGGPYISGTFVVSRDAEYGRNAGSYRMMYRNRRETGIDLVSPSDMRFYYQRMLDRGEPLPIAVAVGVHPFEMLAASYKAPIANDELELAGGLHGAPVPMVKCRTVDLEVPADSEIVLEGEILPIGWTADEGPVRRVLADLGRREVEPGVPGQLHHPPARPDLLPVADAVGERLAVGAGDRGGGAAGAQGGERRAGGDPRAGRELRLLDADRPRSASARARARTRCSRCSRSPRSSSPSSPTTTSTSTTPDDIDWALTFRVQADQDLITLSGARGKHVDPSIRAWEMGQGGLPLTAKLGIDATIPEGIPKWLYKRIQPYGRDRLRLEDYL